MVEALKIEGLYKALGGKFIPTKTPIIKGLSLEVLEGEVFGFLGPNGAGKTTTIKLIFNLLRKDKGEISVFGLTHTLREARKLMGFLPEGAYFYDYLTGFEFLEFYGRLAGLDASESRKQAGELLERVGLAKARDRQMRKYSHGMLQRAGLAQAMIGNPRLLVLDEPMSALDPIGRSDVRRIMRELKKDGVTIFFSSHILADVEMLCDRVAILKDGQCQTWDVAKLISTVGESRFDIVCSGLKASDLPDTESVWEQEGRMLFTAARPEERDSLMEAIRAKGGKIESVVPQKPTLEDAFVKVYQQTQDSPDV